MIDYSFNLETQVKIGTKDFSSCFRGLSFGLPPHEPEQKLSWSGQLTLSLTCQAQQDGITELDLDPIRGDRGFWGPGVNPVEISWPKLGSKVIFRIGTWRWDSRRLTGEATLVQQIDQFDQAFPDLDPDTVYTSPTRGTETNEAVSKLLQAVAAKSRVGFAVGSPGPSVGKIYGQRSTRNPLGEVQAFCKPNWAWLTQNLSDEVANVQTLRYGDSPILFAIPALKAEIEPDYNNIFFSAPKVVVFGGCDVPDEECKGEVPETAEDKTDTDLMEPTIQVYPIVSKELTEQEKLRPTLSQRKSVKKHYLSDPTMEVSDIYQEYKLTPYVFPPEAIDASGMWRIDNIVEEPKGKIFPKPIRDKNMIYDYTLLRELMVTAKTIETAYFKVTLKPKCLVLGKGVDETLVIESVEQLKSTREDPLKPKTGILPGGKHGCYDVAPPEIPKPVEVKLRPKSFKAEVIVNQGYEPPIEYPFVYNMGLCTNQGQAQTVAQQIAIREVARSEADMVKIPLPLEWLKETPHFATCQIGRKVYFIDGPVANISCDDGRTRAELTFSGMLLQTADTEPLPDEIEPYLPGITDPVTATIPSTLNVITGVGSVRATQGVTDVQLESPPSWATVTNGVITIAPDAPAGSYIVNVTATKGGVTSTKPVTIVVAPSPPKVNYFGVATPQKLGIKLKTNILTMATTKTGTLSLSTSVEESYYSPPVESDGVSTLIMGADIVEELV